MTIGPGDKVRCVEWKRERGKGGKSISKTVSSLGTNPSSTGYLYTQLPLSSIKELLTKRIISFGRHKLELTVAVFVTENQLL